MQFHHHGYVSEDPRVRPAAGTGLDRAPALPDQVDVLIVGSGPAGMIAAAQLSQFPSVTTRIIERRPGRLVLGQADGIQARSVETFQSFGFAERIIAEAYRITEMTFWKPDPDRPEHIRRAARTLDDPTGISEFPHLICNQARVLDYFAEVAANGPARVVPDYGVEFCSLEVTGEGDYPVLVRVREGLGEPADGIGQTADAVPARERTIRAKYVVGCDGARSRVRESIGRDLRGDKSDHAWGVMDVLAVTDFPDIRTKCAIQSQSGGNILHIPREGGHLFRMYVDLGTVPEGGSAAVRATTVEEVIRKAQAILHPYTLDVRHVAWSSVYEVGHRVTDKFDDVPAALTGEQAPRVFITGDACHTHSAKAGQGMNVSMQDGWNIAWKLGHVLDGRAPASLLDTYSAERQVIAQNLIDFDRTWSTLMATPAEEFDDPTTLEDFYVKTAEFPAGFMTQYTPSLVTAEPADQALAPGWPVGKRFKSAPVVRVADANPVELGHAAFADGRWRLYVFADPSGEGAARFADWLARSPDSPLATTPDGLDRDGWIDAKVVYQQPHTQVDLGRVPAVFQPRVGPYQVIDHLKVFAADPSADVFELRGVARSGAVVAVRPDGYVAGIWPLDGPTEVADFFAGALPGEATPGDAMRGGSGREARQAVPA
jgi:phenol 2-monooxygenase